MLAHGLRRLMLAALLLVPAIQAQIPAVSAPAAPAKEESSDDPLRRSTPRGAVRGFMEAAGAGDYDQAVRYLDTHQHGETAQELARQLETVLDRESSIDLNRLSQKPDGGQANSPSPNQYLIGSVRTSSGKVEIWLDRVQRGDNPPIWLFSESTLRQIPDVYQDIGNASVLETHLPGWLRTPYLSIPLWRLIIGIIFIPLILLPGTAVIRLLSRLLTKLSERALGAVEVNYATDLTAPLRTILFGILFFWFASSSYTLLVRNLWRGAGKALVVIGVTWLAMRMAGVLTHLVMERLKRVQSSDKIALAGLVGRLSQILVLMVGVLSVLYLAGINLTAALTGLGIGGLAVAFAAQKTLENLFGGIMIISDRPVRIGDACKVGDVNGNVVDIGLRSTRIRTNDRTIVTIPNGQLSVMNLENVTLRDKFWFHPLISLRRETTVDQMQTFLRDTREMLHQHASVEPDTLRVRFIALTGSSQDVEIYSYVFAPDYNDFLRIQEELLLRILGIVESAGTALALPTQIAHLVRESDGHVRDVDRSAVTHSTH